MEEKKVNSEESPDYPLHLTGENFPEAVKKYPLLVVDFWAPWCGPCRMLAPVIESLAKKLAGTVVFGKVNVDEENSLANDFGILSIPTLVVFKNGQKIDQMVGALPERMLEEKLKG
ncbi:MAG TPA: thioredoxin, partial [bacterium]|nr:thioredoxin [bacterium]